MSKDADFELFKWARRHEVESEETGTFRVLASLWTPVGNFRQVGRVFDRLMWVGSIVWLWRLAKNRQSSE